MRFIWAWVQIIAFLKSLEDNDGSSERFKNTIAQPFDILRASNIEIMKAYWNGQLIAESDDTIVVENNYYFPPEAINKDFFKESDTHTICPWKGKASYYTLQANGEENKDAAWYYPDSSDLAKKIENYVAFLKGVEIKE